MAKILDFLLLIELEALNRDLLVLNHRVKIADVLPRLFELVIAKVAKLVDFFLEVFARLSLDVQVLLE